MRDHFTRRKALCELDSRVYTAEVQYEQFGAQYGV
jgi:hypothetical protein